MQNRGELFLRNRGHSSTFVSPMAVPPLGPTPAGTSQAFDVCTGAAAGCDRLVVLAPAERQVA
jgi:hypothetical protein